MSDRVNELEALIRHHQAAYYNGEPEIPDAEFDLLWDELRTLDPTDELFTSVGPDRADGWPKREHLMLMGSQEKAADPDAFLRWAAKVGHDAWVAQYKMDGASIELQYREGVFVCGVTRGDGRVGDDVTPNVRHMRGVVRDLPDRFTGSVRGEVMLSRRVHQEKYADKANTRNAANGLMKRKDGEGSSDLDVIVYDAVEVTRDRFFENEPQKLEWLAARGFAVVEHRLCDSPERVIGWRDEVAARREELEYDIDGLVVKGVCIDPDDMRRARPEKQIAFKFELEVAASTLLGVEWSTSGATYTPIGLIEPVRLAGTTVKRASLVNPRLIREMDLRIGSRIAVTKRGDIIPKIERVLEHPAEAMPVPFPSACERCGTALVDEDTRLYCPNETCPKRAYNRLRRWLVVLDVRDFGAAILQRLFEAGRVATIADLYTLTVQDLTQFERMGETLAAKILRNLAAVTEIPLARFVAGFNIEGVGELIMEKVAAAGYSGLDSVLAATPEELAEVNGIGVVLGRTIADGVRQLEPQMREVLGRGVRITEPAGGHLSGVSFCFTGTLEKVSRSSAQELVRAAGGTVVSSITRTLSYLVTNDPVSGSSKNRKARELGVNVIDEAAFLELVAPEVG